jgi:Tol biopolymer transport system component
MSSPHREYDGFNIFSMKLDRSNVTALMADTDRTINASPELSPDGSR